MKSGSSGRMSEIFTETPTDITEIYNQKRENLNSLPTHRYPIYIDNLNGANETPMVQECIHFTAVKQGGISLQAGADNSKAIAEAEAEQHKQENTQKRRAGDADFMKQMGLAGAVNKVKDLKNANLADNQTADGERVDPDKETLWEKGKRAVTGFVTEQMDAIRQPPKNLEHCFLYMPGSIQYAEGASWGAENLGGVGNLIKEGLRGQGSIDDMLKNFAGGASSKIGTAAAVGAGAVVAGALGAVGVAGLIEGAGAGLKAAGRFVENPYEEQLFNGIGFREFSFEFAFAPSSDAEGHEIDNIIKMFRKHSRPNFLGGGLGEGLYTFPNEFSIDFKMNVNDAFVPNKFLPKINNCVCTNVSTNYTPEGFWIALRDGRPVSYSLSLSFTETKKITQQDVEGGY